MAVTRIALSFDAETMERFMALTELEGKKPATLAADIVKAALMDRAADIDKILTAKKNYQRSIEELRKASKA